MEADRLERKHAAAARRLAREHLDMLAEIRSGSPDKPVSMEYFYERHQALAEGEDPVPGKRRIGIFCTQVPVELILAVGCVPVRLCSGSHAYEQAGAELVHARCCPVVKAATGSLHMNLHHRVNQPAMIVVPATCDQKIKAAEIWRDMGYPVVLMEVPTTRDSEEAREYWYRSVNNLVMQLQRLTGKRITKTNLKAAIGVLREASHEYRKFHATIAEPMSGISASDAFLVTSALFFDEPARWTEALARLNRELEQRKSGSTFIGDRTSPRILMTGSPCIFPNLKTLLLLEKAGATVVADDFCSSSRMLYDTVFYDEGNLYDMIPAVADRYLKPSTCTVFSPGDDRRRNLIRLFRQFSCDGVVYQTFVGCHPFEMEQGLTAKILNAENIETDYSPEDKGQLATRVEAFVESIKARKMRSKNP